MSSPGKTSDIVHKLPAIMPDSWQLFFRYRYPRDIQIESMPYILKGESVCICSPTASGKTEAVIAPLYQRHISFRRNRLAVIYVAPTKALVNDLYHRLGYYLQSVVDPVISRYTGDHHDFKSSDGLFLLLTTPEALDSLQLMHPEKLESVRAIVIDEIHLLHGSPRGQQLRHVMKRIKTHALNSGPENDNFHIVGMSATIEDNLKLNDCWFDNSARFVTAGEPRLIEMNYLSVPIREREDLAEDSAKVVAKWLNQNTPNKILVFGNTRNFTHALAAALHHELIGSRWPVYMHIGVLSGTERERVEKAMKNDQHGICVATSTLEVGIDIGDIDLIVLAQPPYSINSFLQRIGRGNRQSDICRVAALYNNNDEFITYKALHHCAVSGRLDDLHEYDRPSVRFQQVLSLAWRGVRSYKPLTLHNASQKAGDIDYEDVIQDMITTGALKEVGKSLIPNDELMDAGDKRQIHTVIIGTTHRPMIDEKSGETLAFTSGEAVDPGKIFLGGKIKRTVESPYGEVFLVTPQNDNNKKLTRLPSSRGRRGLSRNLIWAIAEIRGIDPKQWLRDGDTLYTWGGFDFNHLIKTMLKNMKISKIVRIDDFSITGLDEKIFVEPEWVFYWSKKINETGSISPQDAHPFLIPSRYYEHLSADLKAVEAINAIPFYGFYRWLKECEKNVLKVDHEERTDSQ